MAITARPYGIFVYNVGQAGYGLGNIQVAVSLATSAYTPDYNNHNDISNVGSAELPTGNGYTAGGVTITNVAFGYNTSTGTATMTGDAVSFANLTATVRYAIIHTASGALIGCIDFGADRVYNNDTLQLTFPSGILTYSIAS